MKNDNGEPMVPLADLEAAWRVGAGHMRRADAAFRRRKAGPWEPMKGD